MKHIPTVDEVERRFSKRFVTLTPEQLRYMAQTHVYHIRQSRERARRERLARKAKAVR